MRLAIMQPYLFPYLGYFQLAASADRFMFLDDVDFIRRGWINRNQVLLDGKPWPFTVPVRHADLGAKINEVAVATDLQYLETKFVPTLQRAYRRSPHYDETMRLVEGVLPAAAAGIGALAQRSVEAVLSHIGLAPSLASSSAHGNAGLGGVDRILDLCRLEGATEYCNAPGGRDLYAPARGRFAAQGIRLGFLEPSLPPYPQPRAVEFVPGLSILDVLMAIGAEATRAMARLGRCVP